MTSKSYSELCKYETFEERYAYLKLHGSVGSSTFGFDRYINQKFYRSVEWRQARDYVIFRDEGCDLGVPGYEIHGNLIINHIKPMKVNDIVHRKSWITNPEFLINTTQSTHNAIHFGDDRLLPKVVLSRKPNDTKLW